MIRVSYFSAAFCLMICSCSSDSKTLFSKIAPSVSGIDFKNLNEEDENKNIFSYEYLYNGGGVALGDLNNDGLTDIYFTANTGDNKLFLNEGNFRFKDITTSSGTTCHDGWKTGVSLVDINADGWLDIYICRSAFAELQLREHILLVNNQDLTFTNRAGEYGLNDNSYSTQAAFFDFDHDGDLDAFLLNHSLLGISNSATVAASSTRRFPYVGNKFLRNDNGRFTDVSDSVGIFGPASNYGLGLSLSDVNNDGWIDIYAGSDYTAGDKLLVNNAGKNFRDVTDSAFSHLSKFTMGTDIADVNGDGWTDICTLDMLPEDNYRQKLLLGADRYNVFDQMVAKGLHYQYMRNMLQLNTGTGYFSEVGQLSGISNTDWSWGPLFADFDNDGILDLFVSNGFKRDLTNGDFAKYQAFEEIQDARKAGRKISRLDLIKKFTENKTHNYVFKGTGLPGFENMVNLWGFEESTLTNGTAYGDLDNDGDLDLVTNNINDFAGVYRNNTETFSKNHYLEVMLYGGDKNKQAIGGRVTVYAGGRALLRELLPVRGFQSSVDPVLHFGLGTTERIDSVVVRWPTGLSQTVHGLNINTRISVTEYHDARLSSGGNPIPLFTPVEGAILFQHVENDFVDFDIQSLLPRKYSTMGPALCIGDVNNDGRLDLFAGGAKGQRSAIFTQNAARKFTATLQPAFETDDGSEDVDAVFFDSDGDGDQDLYVVTGGYEFVGEQDLLQDKLYRNDGRGNFTKVKLPLSFVSGSCVKPCDIDQDGDQDLFVGGRIVPGRYPESPESIVLINDGTGSFSRQADTPELSNIGMVTDAVWADVNGDLRKDLIVVGEWMGVEIFVNANGKLRRVTAEFISRKTEGWWNCIVAEDFDRDGDMDFIVGNSGMNNQIKASETRPASLAFGDFDQNGSVDPIMTCYIGEHSFPFASREEFLEQLPSFKKKFPNYSSYAKATLEDVLTPEQKNQAHILNLVEMRTCYFRNDGGKFVLIPLPLPLQIAPVFSLVVMDVNHDGNPDFTAGGNLSGTRSRTGRMTGNIGQVFLGNGKGDFQYVEPAGTGLRWTGDVRRVVRDGDRLIVATNNALIKIDKLK